MSSHAEFADGPSAEHVEGDGTTARTAPGHLLLDVAKAGAAWQLLELW